ncbi:MAG: hypothetical protein SV598_14025, partial [Pseudomonadota bacterium]|nr:hypothetical protein [Pseudomonadota bacterium]
MKPQKLRGYTGKGEGWEMYRLHLNMVARLNGWDDATTLGHLQVGLNGEALSFYGSLDTAEQASLERVLEAMNRRFGTMVSEDAVRSRLEKRTQKAGESLEQLAEDIRTLAYKVYQHDTPARREKEAVHWFMKAITDKQVVQAMTMSAFPLTDMARALEIAVKAREMAGTYLRGGAKVRFAPCENCTSDTGYTSEGEYDGDDDLEAIRLARDDSGRRRFPIPGNPSASATRPCHFCGKEGHWAKECILRPGNWPDWLKHQ